MKLILFVLPSVMTGWLFSSVNNIAVAADAVFCESYANTAVEQNLRGKDLHIPNLNPPVWSDNRQGHYNWCLSVSQNLAAQNTRYRERILSMPKPAITAGPMQIPPVSSPQGPRSQQEMVTARPMPLPQYPSDQPRPLSGDELRAQLSGNTMVVHRLETGAITLVYLRQDGVVAVRAPQGQEDAGAWTIEGDLYCLQLQHLREGRKACARLAQSANQMLAYPPQGDQVVATIDIIPGDPENLGMGMETRQIISVEPVAPPIKERPEEECPWIAEEADSDATVSLIDLLGRPFPWVDSVARRAEAGLFVPDPDVTALRDVQLCQQAGKVGQFEIIGFDEKGTPVSARFAADTERKSVRAVLSYGGEEQAVFDETYTPEALYLTATDSRRPTVRISIVVSKPNLSKPDEYPVQITALDQVFEGTVRPGERATPAFVDGYLEFMRDRGLVELNRRGGHSVIAALNRDLLNPLIRCIPGRADLSSKRGIGIPIGKPGEQRCLTGELVRATHGAHTGLSYGDGCSMCHSMAGLAWQSVASSVATALGGVFGGVGSGVVGVINSVLLALQ